MLRTLSHLIFRIHLHKSILNFYNLDHILNSGILLCLWARSEYSGDILGCERHGTLDNPLRNDINTISFNQRHSIKKRYHFISFLGSSNNLEDFQNNFLSLYNFVGNIYLQIHSFHYMIPRRTSRENRVYHHKFLKEVYTGLDSSHLEHTKMVNEDIMLELIIFHFLNKIPLRHNHYIHLCHHRYYNQVNK